jgi:hypothetical protein
MTYVYIDKNVYRQNKKQIDKFIDEQDLTKITFNKHPSRSSYVEIYVEISDHFEEFVEYMIRKLGKDIITSLGIKCDNFEKLKEMDCMIPEMYEKKRKGKKRGHKDVVYAKEDDYKLIGILDRYDIYYVYRCDKDKEIDRMYKESMKDKINEYR